MVRDITIGQYYPADSVIHKLDPRVKLMGVLIFIISLFIKKSPVTYLIATVFLVAVIMLSKVPVKFILKGLKPVVFILIFSCVMNMFFTSGDTVLFTYKKIVITLEGVKSAIYLGVRLMYLVIGSSILTYTTTPTKLTDGIEKGLSFLNVFKVPVHEFAMMMSIALRFIPILTEELDKIMKAQSARCASFDEGNMIQKAKSMVPILVPLLVSAMRRADELALAMESRCYQGGKGRTKMYPLIYKRRDIGAYITLVLYLVVMIAVRSIQIGA